MLGFALSGQAAAASSIIQSDTVKTDTLIEQADHVYDVTTATLSKNKKTAFNSFSEFTVDAADTVNLHLPGQAQNLVNLVWDSQAVINGTLNSYLGNGNVSAVGGNVFFADPHGVVVGSGAVLNVGALSLSAPSAAFMHSLLGSDGKLDVDGDAVQQLLTGREEQASAAAGTCLVCINGTIHAGNAVRIRATAIDVSGTISVAATGDDWLATAVNVSGHEEPEIVKDGNTIRLIASDSSSEGIGDAVARSSVQVGAGALLTTAATGRPDGSSADADSWGAIVASADATAESAYADPTTTEALKGAGELLLDQNDFVKRGIDATITDANLVASDKLGQLAYVRAFATADVTIDGTINAGGDVLLGSSTRTTATTDATSTGADGSLPVMITGMYGAVFSKASTVVATGASVSSGGVLRVQSHTDNTLEVSASTVADGSDNFAATTVAWSQAAVDAEARIDGDVTAGSVDVGAHNRNSFSTSASATARDSGGSVGLAGAISLQTINADAALNTSPQTGGDITVVAKSDTTANRTVAETGTDSAESDQEPEPGESDADLADTLAGKTSTDARGGSSFGDKLPFKLGAAVAWTDSEHTATASIGDGVTVHTAGDVVVQAIVRDAGIHNAAISGTASTADAATAGDGSEDDSGGGGQATTVNLAAAVSYGNYQHVASAGIGAGATITARNIGVGSQVIVPFDWSFGLSGLGAETLDKLGRMGDSLDDFIEGANSIPDAVETAQALPGTIADSASGYASASAKGASVDIGGSVNYFAMTNVDRAWVGAGSRLTSTRGVSGDDHWESAFDWSPTAPTTWDHSISVVADTQLAAFNLVGNITPWVAGTEGDSAAVGGAFNYGGYANTTTAGIGSGVSVHSNNTVQIAATSHDTLVVLSPVSGKGGSASMQGTLALTDADDHTHATLSAGSSVTAHALEVTAANPIMVWSLSGALAMSNGASIGISAGINRLTTDTLARIGDNSADEVLVVPGDGTPPVAPVGLAETGGTLEVGSLLVKSTSSGDSGALSVAGSSTSDKKAPKEDGSDDNAPEAGSGSGLLSMLENVSSVADSLRENSDKFASVLAGVDELAGSGAAAGGSSLLDQASDKLKAVSEGDETLQKMIGKATSLKANRNSTKPAPSGQQQKGSFGVAASGAASVNMVNLGTRSELRGITIDNAAAGSAVTTLAINQARLMSGAGGIALTRTKSSSSGGDLAGAVAYSRIADTTAARIDASTLRHARQVAVQALDASEQVGVGVGVAAKTGGSGSSATLAGSVSIGTSANHTEAIVTDSTLDGGSDASIPRSLEVSAYDHSSIGVGAGSLALNTGSGNSANGSLAFTYAKIGNHTAAGVNGHVGGATAYDVDHYDTLVLRALDASLIGAGAATGSISSKGQGLSGAFIWNQIGNSTKANVDGGARIKIDDGILIQANAIEAGDAAISGLDALIDGSASGSGYDFAGAGLAFTGNGNGNGDTGEDADQPGSDSLTAGGWGSSIIAVAGDVSVGKNNVGLSLVGSQVTNTHQVSIANAHLEAGGALALQAQDNTRILSLAVGGGVSTGQFAGMGSATYNKIANTDAVLVGSGVGSGETAFLKGGTIDLQAKDVSAIFSLAGNVAISKGNAAVGGAVTYNRIDNSVRTVAGATALDASGGRAALAAHDNAAIMSGAVAAGGAKGTALMLSFGWNETTNHARATLDDGSTVKAASLDVKAGNDASIESLAGSVAIGGTAGVGLAASIDDIGDNTIARVENTGLDLVGAATVQAIGSGTQYALAVAGAFGGDGAGAGAISYNTIGAEDGKTGNASASASRLYGVNEDGDWDPAAAAHADSLLIDAQDAAAISSLALGVGIGGDVGVGAAVGISTIYGGTSARLDDSVLDIISSTRVSAASTSSIKTLSMAGAASGSVAVSGSDTTNIIGNTISANMADVGSPDGSTGAAVASGNKTSVIARNNSSIASLAGSVVASGSAAVGAAIAVNQIGTITQAGFAGGSHDRTYKSAQLVVAAGAADPDGVGAGSLASIKTIAVGAGGGGDAGVAGSFAINLLGGATDARIDQGANVITSDNVGVLAGNRQSIEVLAGAAAVGGTAGVGVGVAVNKIDGTTSAGIYDSDVTAYGKGAALAVDSGMLADADALVGSLDISDPDDQPAFISSPGTWAAPDLSDTQAQVHGVAVNASNQQNIATLGLGASVSGNVSVNGLVGVNDVGGSTTATIQNARINQADFVPANSGGGIADAGGNVEADPGQQIDVRASSRQYEVNLVANVSGAGTVAADGAAATNLFNASTTASVIGTTATAQAAGTVAATASQWSLNAAMGAAISGQVGAAASAAVTLFNAGTHAVVEGGSFSAGSLDVLATNATRGSQLGGALGFGAGTAGIAGVALVNVDTVETSAEVRDAEVTSPGVVRVKADSSNTSQGVAVGGAAGLYAGVAGGAAVNVIGNRTHAFIAGSTVTASDVAVDALDTQTLDVYSGVFGGGFVGVGGGINLSLLQASVGAGVLDSTIAATTGDVNIAAQSTRNVTSVAASAGAGAVGVGLSAGVIVAGTGNIDDTSDGNDGKVDTRGSLGASGQVNLGGLGDLADGNRVNADVTSYGLSSDQLGSSAVGQINADGGYNLSAATGNDPAAFGASDGVQATVSGGSVAASRGTVVIDAKVMNSTSNTAGGFAAGVVAVGGSLAYTTLNSEVAASVEGGTTVTAAKGVRIAATSGDADPGKPAASTRAIAGSGGLVAVDATVAISHVRNKITASDAGTLRGEGGSLSIMATDSSTASAGNENAAGITVGAIAAGTVVVDALRDSEVSAFIASGTTTTGFDSVKVTAIDEGAAIAQGVMGIGGITGAVGGVVAHAGDTSTVTSCIGATSSSAGIACGGGKTTVTTGHVGSAGSTSVTATAAPTATASAEGITIGGALGVGASIASASVGANVSALIGHDAIIDQGDLGVYASLAPVVGAMASGGAGAVMYSGNAAVARATTAGTLQAGIGDRVKLPDGNVAILAANSTAQDATSSGIVAAGILAIGAAYSDASSNVGTFAFLGNGNNTKAATRGNLTVTATSQDVNHADSAAGSGGLAAGNASAATTSSTSTTSASVGHDLDLGQLANFALTATHSAIYGGRASSINAAAVGASGAGVGNMHSSNTSTDIGDNTTIKSAGSLYVEARSEFASDDHNDGATGGAGGAFVGSAAAVDTSLAAHNTTTLGTGVVLASGLDPASNTIGNLVILADTRSDGIRDLASLAGYGLASNADASASLQGDFTSVIDIGDYSALSSNQRLDIATYAQLQDVGNQASATSEGGAGLGLAYATNDLTSNQAIGIGNDVTIASVGEADIVAGRDVLNAAATELNSSAVAQAYVRGVIAIPHAEATANTTSHAALSLGRDSRVIGGGDVAIGSTQGSSRKQVDGTGHGYELGFIPVTQQDNNQHTTGSAVTVLDGSVVAGQYSKIAIDIDAQGNLSDGGSSSPYDYVRYNADGSGDGTPHQPGGYFNPTEYMNAYSGTSGSEYATGWEDTNVGAIILGGSLAERNGVQYGNDLLVSGGNVYVYGGTVSGNGSVSANGAPSITIHNASPYYLILPGMQTGFGSTGTVVVSGGADPALPGIAVSQTPSNQQPTITVESTFPFGNGYTPGIAWLNPILNYGGLVKISDVAGSMVQNGIVANHVDVDAPNGGITFNHPSEDFTSGGSSIGSLSSSHSWLSGFLDAFISSPDSAAAAIANSVYGKGSTDINHALMSWNPDVYNGSDRPQRSPVVLYGYCSPKASGGCGGSIGIFQGEDVPSVPYIALSQSGKFGSHPEDTGAYNSQTLSVTANYININSPIYVGTPATWTVQTTPALKDWMDRQTGTAMVRIPTVDANGNVLLKTYNVPASQLIGASYNPVTGQIVLDSINAAGGGNATFNGKIVSTGNGSIHVSSGFGQVLVDNNSGAPLVVNNIYTGSGKAGLVTIIDTLHPLADGTPKTTWYLSEDGGPARAYDNSNGATTPKNGFYLGLVDGTTAYQPLDGEQYSWSATTAVTRAGGQSRWSWADNDKGGSAGQHWSLTSVAGSFGQGFADLGDNDYRVELSGHFSHFKSGGGVWYHGCEKGLGSSCNYSTRATGYSDEQGSWHSWWNYIYPDEGSLTLKFVQRADKPIGIAFTSNQTNRVEIDSNADILLGGIISNTNAPTDPSQPDTLLNTTAGGSIVQHSPTALIWTHDLSMFAGGGGSIGAPDNGHGQGPILTRIVHDDVPGSTLSAGTDGGGIYVRVDSGISDQAIHAVAQGVDADGNALHGNVSIIGTGSLVGISGQARDVVGRDIELVSTQGGIGSLAMPLNVETHPDVLYNHALDGGALSAHARSDIGLMALGGDVWVGSIVSEVGDVALSAPDGGIYDARLLTPATTLSSRQAEAIWARLGLNSDKSANDITASLETQVNQAYTQYWRLLSAGNVDSQGAYVLDAGAVALYWPLAAIANGLDPGATPDPTLAQAYAASLYDHATLLFSTYVGPDWQADSGFIHQDASWTYVVDKSSTFYTDLLSKTRWSTDQLTHAINAAALGAPTGAEVGTATPNIQARNIALAAGAGGIGRTVDPVVIPYALFNWLYQHGSALKQLPGIQHTLDFYAQTLAGANTPGDIRLLDDQGRVLQSGDPRLADDLAWITIAQTNPLYLQATGSVEGSASGSVFIQANDDLHLGGLVSGTDMRLAATGDIDAGSNLGSNQPALTAGGNLTLRSGSGSVGFGDATGPTDPGNPLLVQVAGRLLSGAAADNFLLRQLGGDLRIDSVYAGDRVSLTADGGSILASPDGPSPSIRAHDIDLDAAGDIGVRRHAVDGVDSPLQVEADADGLLNATAGGAVNIASPTAALRVGAIRSGGNLTLTAVADDLHAHSLLSQYGWVDASAAGDGVFDTVEAGTGARLTAVGRLDAGSVHDAGGDVELDAAAGMALQWIAADAGNVIANLGGTVPASFVLGEQGSMVAAGDVSVRSSGTLAMGRGSRVQAGGGVTLDAGGDMQLGLVAGTAAAGAALDIHSGGVIAGNGDPLNLRARAGGSTSLQAVGDIGHPLAPLVVDVATLDGSSTLGSVWLRGLGDLSVTDLSASTGELRLDVADVLSYGILVAGTNAVVSAGGIDGGSLVAGRSAEIDSAGDARLNTVTTGTSAQVRAGSDLFAGAIAAGTLSLHAGNDAHLVQGDVGGTADLETGGNLVVDGLDAGARVTTQSGRDTTLGSVLLTHGSLATTAGGDLAVTHKLSVDDGAAQLESLGAMRLAEVATSGDLTARAGTDLSATALNVGGNAALESAARMTMGQARTGGNLEMRAGGDMEFAKLRAGGHVFGRSYQGSIAGAFVRAGDWIKFIAAGDIHVASLETRTDAVLQAGRNIATGSIDAGHDVLVQAGGDVAMEHTRAGNYVSVDAGGALMVGDTTASRSISLAAASLQFDSLQAPESIHLLARRGSIAGASLTTRDAYAAARDDIRLDAALIGDRINLAGTTIDARVTQATSGQPIYSVLTGFKDGVATRITVDVDASGQWLVERLAAINAKLATTAASVHIEDGRIEGAMSLDTADASLRMNQRSAALVPADVQLIQPTYEFLLYQDGMHTFSDAFIVRYGHGFEIQAPNYDASHQWLSPDYLGESALRYNGRTLSGHSGSADDAIGQRAIPIWIRSDPRQLVQPDPSGDGTPVNLTKAPQ